MLDAQRPPLEHAAALLERAYRMALALQGHADAGALAAGDAPPDTFEAFVLARELVALLDDARIALLAQAARPGAPLSATQPRPHA